MNELVPFKRSLERACLSFLPYEDTKGAVYEDEALIRYQV